MKWSKLKILALIVAVFNLAVLLILIKRSNVDVSVIVLNSTYLGGFFVLCNEKILELCVKRSNSKNKGLAIRKTILFVLGWLFLIVAFILSLQKVLNEYL